MECPYCHKPLTEVANSRPTKNKSQVWRRRKCLNCSETFTTHEIIDLSNLIVIKKSGENEMYSRISLYSGIHLATIGSDNVDRQKITEKTTREVEKQILSLRKKKITSFEIADIVLSKLRKIHTPTFLRYLIYCKDINSEQEMKREFVKYTL